MAEGPVLALAPLRTLLAVLVEGTSSGTRHSRPARLADTFSRPGVATGKGLVAH